MTAIVTPVATLRDAAILALPEWQGRRAATAEAESSVTTDASSLVALHACIESDAPARCARSSCDRRRACFGDALGANRRRSARRRRAQPPCGYSGTFYADVRAATDAASSTVANDALLPPGRKHRMIRCCPASASTWSPDKRFPASDAASAVIAECAAASRTLLSERAAASILCRPRSDGTLLPLGTHRLCDLRPPRALHEWIDDVSGPIA